MVDTTFAEGFVFVNVYEMGLAYGGAEEGGWWVTCGSLIESHQVPEAIAEGVRMVLEDEYPTAEQAKAKVYWESLADEDSNMYVRRHGPIYRYTDVNYYGGDYRVRIEDKPGADFPEVFPSYE